MRKSFERHSSLSRPRYLVAGSFCATCVVHAVAVSALWGTLTNDREVTPPKPIELTLIAAPPPPAAPPPAPEPPLEPAPLVAAPELTPPLLPDPEPVAAPTPPPAPRPEPVARELPRPPPQPKRIHPVVAGPQVETRATPRIDPPPMPQLAMAAPPISEQLMTEPSFDAAYLHNPQPPYPRAAKRSGLEGTVILRVLVGPEGKPQQIRVHESSGMELLDAAAVDAVLGWRFVPAKQGARAITAAVDVPIRFKLN